MSNIPFSTVLPSHKALTINCKSVFANKCIGSTSASLNTFCTMMVLPAPVSQKQYREHAQVINDQCIAEAQESMRRARQVHECYDVAPDDVIDVTVSSDNMWQRKGFSSLFGITFIIEHETKKVLDYEVMCRM